MTYWLLDVIFLAIAAVVVVLVASATRRRPQEPIGVSLVITATLLLATTAIFDNVMIGIGLVAYNPARIMGIYVGSAPLEDFSYALAAAIILPALWVLIPERSSFPDLADTEGEVKR